MLDLIFLTVEVTLEESSSEKDEELIPLYSGQLQSVQIWGSRIAT